MLYFNLDYTADDRDKIYDMDQGYDHGEDHVIYPYIPADQDREESPGLYSDLLDSMISGLNLFAQNPKWTDGQKGFDRFEELMTQNCVIDGNQYGPVIYDPDRVERALRLMKKAVAELILGFDMS